MNGRLLKHKTFFCVSIVVVLLVLYKLCLNIAQLGAELEPHFWKPVLCAVKSIRAVYQPGKYGFYSLEGQLQYNYLGQQYVSDSLVAEDHKFLRLDLPVRLEQETPPGSNKTCFVNPSNPAQAVLFREGYFNRIVLVVVWFLALIAITAFALLCQSKSPLREEVNKTRFKLKLAKLVAGSVAGLFLIGGVYGVVNNLINPLTRWHQARSWEKHSCAIEHADLNPFVCGVRGGAGCSVPNFSLIYSYEINGKIFKAARFDLLEDVARRYKKGVTIVKNAPVGKKFDCFVNPEDPLDAVIDRKLSLDHFIGVIGFGFLFVAFAIWKRLFTLNRKT